MSRRRFVVLSGIAGLAALSGCGSPLTPGSGGRQNTGIGDTESLGGYDDGVIPEELEYIPDGYTRPAEHAGTLERLDYQTYESFTYAEKSQPLQKTAWVYVPYGYSPDSRYDILYLSHGGWSNETTIMGAPDDPHDFKHIVDHAIEDGRIAPMLIVLPTYNNTSGEDSGDYGLAIQLTANFHNELVGDLMPAAESKYSTYAEDATAEGLSASRDHRGFAGFSMGSVNTWRTFQNCLDYFRFFIPMSGSLTTDGDAMAQMVRDQGREARDFFIFAMSGTSDFAYSAFKQQVENMAAVPDGTFVVSDTLNDGNLAFRERQGYTHDADAANEYTYNGMRFFWHVRHGEEEAGLPYTADTPIDLVRNDPAFDEWGRLIFPVDAGYMGGSTLGTMTLTWYSNIVPDETVTVCNYLRSHAEAGDVFYDIYTEDEKAADPQKVDTGLFFFRGETGGRVAFCNAGGGFSYVAAMHDSFPHALELSRRGYNAFALVYRPGAQTGCEDLARAVAFVSERADELGVDMDGYSLWGGSAGARMAAWVGTSGTESFGERAYPRPAAVIMQYTGLSSVTGNEPPTYACVGTSDGIANWRTMQTRIEAIRANGTPAEIEVFTGLSHGFGLGTGTVAEGWIDRAIAFWRERV